MLTTSSCHDAPPGKAVSHIESRVGDGLAGVLRHRGRRSGAFSYRTTLPAGVDADRVTARFEGGVLTVTVPRPESSKPHRVKIS
jgi:HSP20 family molecular chaperone IbpA